MQKSDQFFPQEAMQIAQDPIGALQILAAVTAELPYTHKFDWAVVSTMENTIRQFVEEAAPKMHEERMAQETAANTPANHPAEPVEDGTKAPEAQPEEAPAQVIPNISPVSGMPQ